MGLCHRSAPESCTPVGHQMRRAMPRVSSSNPAERPGRRCAACCTRGASAGRPRVSGTTEIPGRLEVVPGQDAQPPGIQRQGLPQSVLHAEIGNLGFSGAGRCAFVPKNSARSSYQKGKTPRLALLLHPDAPRQLCSSSCTATADRFPSRSSYRKNPWWPRSVLEPAQKMGGWPGLSMR
jgi:hypothetical protein